jgi:leucyl aminopeptidase (aminopeptidase T)
MVFMIKKSALKAVFESALKLKPTESCLILTDTLKEPIAKQFFDYISKINSNVHFEVMEPLSGHGQEPLPRIADLMKKFDVELLITTASLSHTNARRGASSVGARIASMPILTEEICNRCLDVDYEKIKENSDRLQRILQASKIIRVTSKAGTDIIFKRGDMEVFSRPGKLDFKGAWGNLPSGEVEFGPMNANGKYFVDGSLSGFEKLKTPLIFSVTGGVVVEIEGKRSEEVKHSFDSIGPKAYVVAELGIGTNPKAIVTGNTLEDEKAAGTCHIAVGNNVSYGGKNEVPLHQDGLIKKPTIFADGKIIMKNGKLLL